MGRLQQVWLWLVLLGTGLFGIQASSGSDSMQGIDAFHNVVVFVRFADETTYEAPYDLAYYDTLFNGVDTTSLRDYYLDVSYGQLTIDSHLAATTEIVFYTDPLPRSYYQPYDEFTNPGGYQESEWAEREHALLKGAIDFVADNALISPSLDLDTNGDGDIDSLTFLVSGDAGNWMDLLWPHQWSLYSYYDFGTGSYQDDAPMLNGAYAYNYTLNLLGTAPGYELEASLSVLAHEMFHVLGAPDLYHYYRYDWINPVGHWGLMDTLTDPPSHMLGYMKEQYGGWMPAATPITTDGTYTLGPLNASPNHLMVIDTGYSNEVLYLEYRDQSGTYEANTPQRGLVVYRVDYDYLYDGNVQGYYRTDGSPANEVFVFRPGITDVFAPYTFEEEDDPRLDEDGITSLSGLSQNNPYDAIGMGTEIPLFHSDGTPIDITIANVTEINGEVTFEVTFHAPRVTLVHDLPFPNMDQVRLIDAYGTSYQAMFTNIDVTDTVYYTTDGSEPTIDDTLYTGAFSIDATNAHVRAVVVDALGNPLRYFEQVFEFVSTVTTDHNPYGDYETVYYVVSFPHPASYELSFDRFSRFADDSDRLMVVTEQGVTTHYDDSLRNATWSFLNDGAVFVFQSDGADNDGYGFDATIDVHWIDTGLSFVMNGESSMTVEVFDSYTDPGIQFSGDGADEAYYVVSGSVDTDALGTYRLTYDLYSGTDEWIGTLVRDVDVVDTTPPEIVLNGEDAMTLEVGSTFLDPGVTVFDNYELAGDVLVTGSVDSDTVGTYTLYYSIFDGSGNRSDYVMRTIEIVDTTAPDVELLPGIDTIVVGESWMDAYLDASDNATPVADLIIEVVQNTVDVTTPGTYHVIYRVVDASGNHTYLTRIVTVLALPTTYDVVCEPMVHTVLVGAEVEAARCQVNGIELTSSAVDTSAAGTVVLRYTAVIAGKEIEHVTYVFVLDQYEIRTEAVLPKRRDDL
jgi:M6 family metalloprotease-like protein